jgi:hypothetical protein
MATSGDRPELNRREQVVGLELRIVGNDLIDRHPRGEKLQEVLDRIPQAAHRWLPVADRGISRNAI